MINKYSNTDPSPALIRSNINDPFINLAIENWVFKNWLKDKPMLMIWQNKPSLIIGRAQNPWLECDLISALKDKIPIARRQSGGGTVFHDPGNINFTFLMPNKIYNKKAHLNILIIALKKLGINTFINERNDIITQIDNQNFKLSGSAYRETKNISFHHGTLLVKSNLELLKKYLHHKQDKNITAKGVTSVRSSVTSINHIDQKISIQDITKSINQVFYQSYHYSNPETYCFTQDSIKQNKAILEHANELQQWEWIYAKSLPFKYNVVSIINSVYYKINLEIKHGRIENFKLDNLIQNDIPILFLFLNSQPRLITHELLNISADKKLSSIEHCLISKMKHLFI